MDEKRVKFLVEDWMYNHGYNSKGSHIYPVILTKFMTNGKELIPHYNPKNYNFRSHITIDDLFELHINEKAKKSPFIFNGDTIPKYIAFEYKSNDCGTDGFYTAVGQALFYYYILSLPIYSLPIYLVIDVKNYLIDIFSKLPYGVICYNVKGDKDIKVFKSPIIPSV